jgi:hypothetical protein
LQDFDDGIIAAGVLTAKPPPLGLTTRAFGVIKYDSQFQNRIFSRALHL